MANASKAGNTDHLRAPTRSLADPLRQATTSLVRWQASVVTAAEDELVVEEPLEIRVRTGDDPRATEEHRRHHAHAWSRRRAGDGISL